MTYPGSSSMMMLMESYDEDLSQNAFLVQLQDRCPQLHETTANNRWMICVPRSGSSGQREYQERDFLNHILIQLDHKPGTYKTLSDKEVVIESNVINTGQGFPEERTVPILFEETFFNPNDESYRVLCVNQMLEGGPVATLESADGTSVILRSLGDCVELLWGRSDARRSQKQLDELIDLFNRTCSQLDGESLRHQVDAANALFTRAMQTVLKDATLKQMAKCNKLFMDNVKLAVETYVTHGVYRKLFKNITTSVSSQDAHLNKTTRNLSELQLKDLQVRTEFFQNIPRARRELCNLNRYSTPMGKLNCIKRVVKTLMEPPKKGLQEEEGVHLTTDDLLPILVFLVVKSGTANWWANFAYMTSCRFSKSSNDDEFGFYLASLEAALEHVGSGQLGSMGLAGEAEKRVQLPMSPGAGSLWQRSDSSDSNTELLFQCVRENNIAGAEDLLSAKRQTWSDIQSQLCHPLCSCDQCEDKMARARNDPTAVTAYSRDDRGLTVLHAGAMFGHTEMTDFLINRGAVVNATDYHGQSPLHISCQKGHQGVTLLLLHHKANVNLQDNDYCTPLHLAAANGHEDCVKALIYYDQGSTLLEMNLGNDFGDTPLHLAAKWGYEGIVDILLENGAAADVRNRKKQTPLHCAHNLNVSRLLVRAQNHQQDLNAIREHSQTRRLSLSDRITHSLPAVSASCPDLVKAAAAHTSLPRSPSLTGAHTLPRNVAAKRKKRPLNETEKKVEKLLKAVADGDVEMAKFHLGLSEEDLDDELEVDNMSPSDLCHPLCQCQRCKPLQKLTQVTPSGLHINCSNPEGFTPLHVAAMHGHETLLELFLKRGANVNERNKTQECTALHLACQNNKPRAVSLLVLHKAKVSAKDARGNTPLHYCCLNASHACAEILLKNGAGVNQANYKGNAPLHEAARWNVVIMTQLLVRYGALVGLRNRQQLTPVQLAQNDRILRILCEAGVKQSRKKKTEKLRAPDSKVKPSLKPKENIQQESANEDSPTKKLTVRELFAAFEEEDLQQLQNLAHSIQSFDRDRSLRHTVTRDRSAPRLDQQLLHQLSIQNFDTAQLRHTQTSERSSPVLFLGDEPLVEMLGFSEQEELLEVSNSGDRVHDSGAEVRETNAGSPRLIQKEHERLGTSAAVSVSDVEMISLSQNSQELHQPLPDNSAPFHFMKPTDNCSNSIDADVNIKHCLVSKDSDPPFFDEQSSTEDLFSCVHKQTVTSDEKVTMNTSASVAPGEAESEPESENSNTESHEDWVEEVTGVQG